MKFIFYSNVNLSKFSMLHESFCNPGQISRKNRCAAKRFRDLMRSKGSKNSERVKIFEALIGDNAAADLKKLGCSELISILNEFEIPTVVDISFKSYANKLTEQWHQKELGIKLLLREIFGFKLPKLLYVVLSENYQYDSGSLYAWSPNFILTLSPNVSKTTANTDPVSVLLHELLHGLIRQKKKIMRKSKQHSDFEEALLDYFAPVGLLTEKLGLIKKRDIAEYRKINARTRSKFNYISKQLLPIMEEYYKNQDDTIWGVLENTEFKKYLNAS